MADFYVDHGAYGLASNRLGLDAPTTWGVPQEGDGLDLGASPTASTGSIVFSAVPTTGTITVCGASVSTTGVIGAASVDAAANALAANINANTNAVSSTFCQSGTPTNLSRLQNIVYARGPSGGAPAGTCQVMARIGAASYNTTTFSSTLDGSPTLNHFTGGVSGCWGLFINPAALGVSSSIGAFGYGVLLYKQAVGLPTINDTVWARTGGGASKTITLTWATNATLSHGGLSKSIVFDTNTKWTGDSPTGKLKLVLSSSAWNTVFSLPTAADGQLNAYRALAYGGFEIEAAVSGGARAFVGGAGYTGGLGVMRMTNVIFRDSGADSSSYMSLLYMPNGQYDYTMQNCAYLVTTPRTTIYAPAEGFFKAASYNANGRQVWRGCVFDFNISGVSDPGGLCGAYSQIETELVVQGCEFKGYASGYTLMASGPAAAWAAQSARLRIIVDNCSGLKMPATYAGMPSATKHRSQHAHQLIFSNANLSTQAGLRVEDCRGVAEWVPDDSTPFPYLSSTLAGSGSPYALRLLWIRSMGLSEAYTYESPPFRMFMQLAAAQRTIKQRLFCHSSVTAGVVLSVSYIDSTGIARTQFSSVIASDTATWTNAGSYSGFVAKHISITTDYAVKANSEIVTTILFTTLPPGTDAIVPVYVDPEFLVT